MANYQKELNLALKSVGYTKERHEVLTSANGNMPFSDFLDKVIIPEIEELAEENESWRKMNMFTGEQVPPPKNWIMELFDVLVTLKVALDRLAPKFSVEEQIFPVNGQFKGGFNSLKDQASNLETGNIERNFKLIFTELLSMLKHLDIDLQTKFYVDLTNAKLEANKESRFYQKEPSMSEDDIMLKYDHVTTALRLLRNFLRQRTGQEITLEPWITDFFVTEILDWRNSEKAMARMRQQLLAFQQKITDEVLLELNNFKKSSKPSIPSIPNFKIKMLIAGAKPLQSWSSNATLAETTAF